MFSQIMAVFAVLKELIAFIKSMIDLVERKKIEDRERRRQALLRATEDMKKAKTDAEIWAAQQKIVDNSK